MARTAVAAAFHTKIGDSFQGLQVEGFDEVFTDPPVSNLGFIAVQFPVVNGQRPIIGRRFFEVGVALFVLNIKREIGWAQARAWADAVADLFRATDFDHVQTFEPNGPVETNNNDNGSYIALSVAVPYRYQFDG